MKLSVIIVNYNVRNFLEQCLHSVRRASEKIQCEVFVVDNNSADGSNEMIEKKFPEVKLIRNKENLGFSKANNMAINQSQGEYILLLNPDTLVEEDCFEKICKFMDNHEDAGALGVKMIDGKGKFLPESKRALPTPTVAFYKIFGLSTLFPKSEKFGRYHLGNLSADETHKIEILAGAFMLLRKEALNKTGLLDETFFMYGEDIDLSYRIIQEGYNNYYFPDTTIIHYKGESTKKGSINYVVVFYNAMIIFAKKHFSKKNANLFSTLIKVAIYLRAILAMFKRVFLATLTPVLDGSAIFLGYYLIKPVWESYKFQEDGHYPEEFLHYVVPSYILAWIASVFATGGYQRPIKPINSTKGIIIGTIIILTVYALLPEQMRFSRALILFGTGIAIFSTFIIRFILHHTKIPEFKLRKSKRKNIIIAAGDENRLKIITLLKKSKIKFRLLNCIDPGTNDLEAEISNYKNADELIFCLKEFSPSAIIQIMEKSKGKIGFKIASPDANAIVGSDSADKSGEIYLTYRNPVSSEENKRNKRIFDLSVSLFFILTLPLVVFLMKNPLRFIGNTMQVLFGSKTWVGYKTGEQINTMSLPKISIGVVSLADCSEYAAINSFAEKANHLYARNYKVCNDAMILLRNFRYLGNR